MLVDAVDDERARRLTAAVVGPAGIRAIKSIRVDVIWALIALAVEDERWQQRGWRNACVVPLACRRDGNGMPSPDPTARRSPAGSDNGREGVTPITAHCPDFRRWWAHDQADLVSELGRCREGAVGSCYYAR